MEKYPVGDNTLDGRQFAEHEALNYCEQLLADSRELEETKREYRTVTNYLNDIQILEDLPEQTMEHIRESAMSVDSLNQTRDSYKSKKKRISDTQYAQMASMEDEIPGNIRRMQNNENYQTMVKRDMDYLEGEKVEWQYYLESLIQEQKYLKIGIWVLLFVFAAGFCVLEYLQYALYKNMTTWLLAFTLVAALVGGFCILRMDQDRREAKKAQSCIKRAIVMANRMKAKYVSVANAVDYACEKYRVQNSMELSYLWEQYLEAVQERKSFERTNEDLEYFGRKLVRELKQLGLYDATIWLRQCPALIDKREMVEVKHYLLEQRQKLRDLLNQQVDNIQDSKKQIMALLKDNKEYHKEIMDVLESIDQICGVS